MFEAPKNLANDFPEDRRPRGGPAHCARAIPSLCLVRDIEAGRELRLGPSRKRAIVAVLSGLVAVAVVLIVVAPWGGSSPRGVAVGSAPHRVAGSRAIGSLPATTPIAVTVTLRPRNPAALALAAGSGTNGGYITPSQFAARFGATPAHIAAVASSLRAHGLHPEAASPNGLSISLSATAGQLAHAFSISFQRFVLPGGRTAFANTSPPLLDARVARFVQGIIGLDDLTQEQPLSSGPSGVTHPSVGPAVVAPSSSTTTDAGLRRLALSVAADSTGSAPTRIVAVRTTYAAAVAAIEDGDKVSGAGSQPVEVISMTGHFVDHLASVPSGAALPSGTVSTIIVLQATGAVVESMLSSTEPPLSKLGQVVTLSEP